ncbi:hypothetical protein R3P38DRAFT_2779763 [Favolaschia claudopus]|uniref:Uncharacterized protein n=1 Tax=Favolaschia claudopus TaxID=2862362 RepID=A0AAW0BBL2_9AGAR
MDAEKSLLEVSRSGESTDARVSDLGLSESGDVEKLRDKGKKERHTLYPDMSPRRGDCLEDFNSSPYPNVGGVEFEGAESPRDDCSREGCYDDINTYGNTHTKSRAWESAIANTTSKNQSIPASTRVLSLAPWRFEDGPERGDAAQMFHGTCGGGEKLSGFERRISEGRLRGKGFSTHIDSNNIPSPRSYSGNGQAAHSQRPLKYQHRHNWSQNPDRGEREYEQHAASGIWSEKVAWRLGDLTRRFVDDVKRRAKQKPDRAFGDLRQLQLLSSIRDVDSKEVNLKRSSWRESRRQRFLEDGKHRKHFEEGALAAKEEIRVKEARQSQLLEDKETTHKAEENELTRTQTRGKKSESGEFVTCHVTNVLSVLAAYGVDLNSLSLSSPSLYPINSILNATLGLGATI